MDQRRAVTPAGMTRLENWASRKPCIALMGEFSAGKTTLTNLLVGEDVLPTRVTATQLPPVWMSFGEPQAWYVDTEGHRHDLSFDDLDAVPVEGVRYIRLFCKGRILETIDLIDTPGISDPNIPKSVWEMAVGYVNAVVWCTHSTQAWRESERSAWDSLPERLRENSLLLATRSDKLLPAERERVARRLRREAGETFRGVIMFSALDALRAVSEEDTGDLWVESGGEALLSALHEVAHDIIEARKGLLSRYSLAGAEGIAPVRVRPGRAARQDRGERDDGEGRTRLSRDDGASMRSRIMDDETASQDLPDRADAEVLHLSFAQRVQRHEDPANGPALTGQAQAEREAEIDPAQPPVGADETVATLVEDLPEAVAGDEAAISDMDEQTEATAEEDDNETRIVPCEHAEEEPAAISGQEDGAEWHEEVPVSAVSLWRGVLASEGEPRSIQEMLALFEKFLHAVDIAEGIEPAEEADPAVARVRHG